MRESENVRVSELPSSIKVTEALTHWDIPRSLSTNCAGKWFLLSAKSYYPSLSPSIHPSIYFSASSTHLSLFYPPSFTHWVYSLWLSRAPCLMSYGLQLHLYIRHMYDALSLCLSWECTLQTSKEHLHLSQSDVNAWCCWLFVETLKNTFIYTLLTKNYHLALVYLFLSRWQRRGVQSLAQGHFWPTVSSVGQTLLKLFKKVFQKKTTILLYLYLTRHSFQESSSTTSCHSKGFSISSSPENEESIFQYVSLEWSVLVYTGCFGKHRQITYFLV